MDKERDVNDVVNLGRVVNLGSVVGCITGTFERFALTGFLAMVIILLVVVGVNFKGGVTPPVSRTVSTVELYRPLTVKLPV